MPFTALSIASVALAAASVGALYALHHLRIQPQQRPIATLLFWQQAIGPSQARALWASRFVRRRTFLLLAGILLLLCASLTADRWFSAGRDTKRGVIVIDAGSATALTDANNTPFLRTLTDRAKADLGRLPAGAAVISAGPQPLLIGAIGEPAALAARRLDALSPGAGASASLLAIQMAGNVLGEGDGEGRIDWYTPQVAVPSGLPEALARRVVVHHVNAPEGAAITGVTFEPTRDDGHRGTLRVHVAGTNGTGMTVQVEDGSRPTVGLPITVSDHAADAAFENRVADGRSVRVRLRNASGAPAGPSVSYRLPDRRPLTFTFADNVPRALRIALMTIGREGSPGDVFVAMQGTPIPAGTRAAVVVAEGGGGSVRGRPLQLARVSSVRGLDLEGATAADGPPLTAAATPLITAGPAAVAGVDRATACPTLYLSRAIVDDASPLTRRAVFPVFLRRVCDDLVGREDAPAAIAALRVADDPLWSGPGDAPTLRVIDVADPPTPPEGVERPATLLPASHTLLSVTDVVLLVALTLLGVETLLLAARKIA